MAHVRHPGHRHHQRGRRAGVLPSGIRCV